ncbi:acyl carrier protein [Nonomuraea sp. NPDC003804]|uniref:acyl carrier protein n=1 Tax=Nonomuraea sp. NPDC003804 TaxID=3154547 RepID=UPI0033A4AEC5
METVISEVGLHDILTRHLGLEPDVIAGAAQGSLSDLGVDSIGVIELEKVIFDQYGINLPEGLQAMTIDQILHHVNTATRSGN